MRLFILALDGLSYELVHLWNLKHLKQERYGKFPSIINRKHGEPLSPQVWGSFVTGITQDIDDWKVYTKIMNWIRWKTPLKWIRGSEQVSMVFGKRSLLPVLKMVRRQKKYVGKEELVGPTIFDEIPDSIALNIPAYNLNSEWLFGYTQEILNGDMEKYESYCKNLTEEMIEETLRRVDEDWSLFMTWIPLADHMGHVFIARSRKTQNVYNRLNMLAYNVSSRLPEDCLLLIVSDHGMKVSSDGVSGCHTNHAFYSLSKEINWRPRAVTDFYNFIKRWVMGSPKQKSAKNLLIEAGAVAG